eukprot:scaffold117992_cov18-Phaeocystis_antarctica.AAC.1
MQSSVRPSAASRSRTVVPAAPAAPPPLMRAAAAAATHEREAPVSTRKRSGASLSPSTVSTA